MLDAGKLDARVTIQSPVAVSEGAGGNVLSWSTAWTRWAQILTMAGRESRYAGAIIPQHSHVVRLRYLPELTTRHRILWGSRVLEILSVADKDNKHEETVCECNEVEK